MKVAIVHDILLEYGGAERVLDGLLKIFPKADIYTFYYNSTDRLLKKYQSKLHGSSFLSKIPKIEKLQSLLSITKLFSWCYFHTLNLNQYDLIISSTHSYGAKAVRRNKKALHVSYIHTSPRYLYGEVHELFWINQFPLSIIFYPLKKLLIFIDQRSTKRPDVLLANSKNTQEKIKKIYGLSSSVVYPPVFVNAMKHERKKYFIAHGRLVRQKGFELIIHVCTKYNLPLVVIGDGYYKTHLKKIAGKTIMFVGSIRDQKVEELYKNAFALLYAAHADDFGLVPVESIARGVPVIGYFTGGLQETLIDGVNGVAFREYTSESLTTAIKFFLQSTFDKNKCKRSVEKFSWVHFKKQITTIVSKYEN